MAAVERSHGVNSKLEGFVDACGGNVITYGCDNVRIINGVWNKQ